jgi:signal peptide peptidase SppA
MKHKLTHKLQNEVWAIRPDYHSALTEASAYFDEDEEYTIEPNRPPQEVDGVAIIHIHGALGKMLGPWERMLGMTDYDDIWQQVSEAEASPNVTSILLHIDSPGGTITGLPELAAKLRNVSKPLVAYTEGMAASAACWVASCADSVIVSESAEVGSVGVYIALLDQSEHLAMNGFKVNAISSGENKLDLADFKPLSEEAEARLQANVTKWHDRFKADINLKRTAPESSMTGLTYEGFEAVSSGLADAVVNDLDSVLALMGNL